MLDGTPVVVPAAIERATSSMKNGLPPVRSRTVARSIEGIAATGAIVGAAIAEAYGIRVTVWLAVLGRSLGIPFLFLSPLLTMRAVSAHT